MKNELIILEQLPVIKYQLEQLSKEIKEKVDRTNKLVVSEDTVKDVKKTRAELNKEFAELETKRKQVKSAIMAKYDEFEEIYRENVANLYKNADLELKTKIDEVENNLKEEKEQELIDFFKQYQETYHLDFLNFNDIGLNITLSASMKSLKDQIKDFCIKIDTDIKLIQNDENKDELMLEYRRNGFDYQKAKLTLIEKQKQLEELKQQMEHKQEIEKQEEKVIEQVQEIIPPKEIIKDEEILESTFTVKAKKDKLKLLIEFMNNNEIEVIE